MSSIDQLMEKVKGIYDELSEIKEKEESKKKDSMSNTEKIFEYAKNKNFENEITIHNSCLEDSNEYRINTYLKMLAAVLQQGEEIKEEQAFLFCRMILGIDTDKGADDYLKMALTLTEKDFDDFCELFKDNGIKYRFVLDAMLLTIAGGQNDKQLRFIAEIISLLEIDTYYKLSSLAKGIATKDSFEIFLMSDWDKMSYTLFTDYTRNIGEILVGDREKLIIVDPNERRRISNYFFMGDTDYDKLDIKIKAERVYIRNAYIRVTTYDDWDYRPYFIGNEYVELDNCCFVGNNNSIVLDGCKKVVIKNCTFEDWIWFVFFIHNNVDEVIFDNCKFKNCYKTEEGRNYSSDVLGGVIYCKEQSASGNNTKISINNCDFEDCGGVYTNAVPNAIGGLICNAFNLTVKGSKFKRCYHYHMKDNERVKDKEDDFNSLFRENIVNQNNTITDCVKFNLITTKAEFIHF